MDVSLRVSVLCCLWIEKSIKEGQGPIRTVEAS
jgi:hypothetical protein